jgi:HEAT repeat protein
LGRSLREINLSRENENAIPPQAYMRNKSMSGSGGGGGYEYQARAAAYVAAHILAQEPLGWVEHESPDVPVAVAEETGGAGDDLCITLHDGVKIELQAKHGLKKDKLWEPLIKLGQGLQENPQLYGVLLTDTTASKIIREDLRNDFKRLGQGRTDGLKTITQEAQQKLVEANLPDSDPQVFRRLRIVVLDLDDGLQDGKQAQLLLSKVLHDSNQSANAWKILWGEGLKLITNAGNRDSRAWARLLSSQGIQLTSTCSKTNDIRSMEESEYLNAIKKKYRLWWDDSAKFMKEFINESTWYEFRLNVRMPIPHIILCLRKVYSNDIKIEDAAKKCGYGSDIEKFEQELIKFCGYIGFKIGSFQDFIYRINDFNKEYPDINEKVILPILDGLKAALHDHTQEPILIIGKPGAGKSTFLAHVLLMSAERMLQDEPHIPVLISSNLINALSNEQQSNIVYWIKAAFEDNDFLLGVPESDKLIYIESLIKRKQLLILIDAVNEVLGERARDNLKRFCNRNLSIILTTRDIGAGILNIQTKLEIQPLKTEEVKKFLNARLPNHQHRVRELCDHVQDFGQTPLIAWMLYSIFQQNPEDEIPKARGEAYRRFTTIYAESAKEGIDLNESRSQLSQLAFKMTCSREPAYEQDVQNWLGTEKSLKYLLSHHLLQWDGLPGSRKVEFCHQSLQEYYAAEYLRSRLPEQIERNSDQCYTPFQINYLNYLKWTEAIALMLGLPDITNERVIEIINQVLDVDIFLGSKLVGSIKSELQEKLISLVEQQTDQDWLKAKLLGITRSDSAISSLGRMLQNHDSVVRWHVVHALWLIGSNSTIHLLIQALDDTNYSVRQMAGEALENISNSSSVIVLKAVLKDQNQPSDIRKEAIKLLKLPFCDDLFSFLTRIAQDPNQEFWLRRSAAFDISIIDQEVGVDLLHKMMKEVSDTPKEVLNIVSIDLREIRNKNSIEPLLEILNSYENLAVRCSAAITLASIGSQKAISPLLEILCSNVAYALRGVASPELFEISLKILKKPWEDANLRGGTLEILCNRGDQEVIEEFKKIIFNGSEDQMLRKDAIQALRFLDNWTPSIAQRILESQLPKDLILKHKIIDILQELDKDESIELLTNVLHSSEDSGLKSHAASALHRYSDRGDILSLLKEALKNSHQDVRQRAAKSLARPGNECAVSQLLKLLEGGNSSDRQSAIRALGSIGSKKAYNELLKVFQDNDEDLNIRNLVIWALTQIDAYITLDLLTEHLKHIQDRDLLKEIIIALGKSSEPKAVKPLLHLLSKNNEDSMIQNFALHALGQVATLEHISTLINLPPIMFDGVIAAIAAIQSRCGFYNYDIAQSLSPELPTEVQKGGSLYNFPNVQKVQIIERIDNYNENQNS